VYDRSRLCEWSWIPGKLREPPRRWALLHAGLDVGSARLRALFPEGEGQVIDFFDARTMTEPSIRRARQANAAANPSPGAAPGSLPLASEECDAVFLLFAAHEVRDPAARLRFFAEVARALRGGGRAIVVEHLRDAANFLAFGPGFLHFLPRREWLRLAEGAGLELAEEFRFTPFVRVFVLERPR
jgi:SAM-dependent methyltransferase